MNERPPNPGTTDSDESEQWAPVWSPAQRESFFAAIARNRRASWQVAAICLVCSAAVAFVAAALMAPLLYAIVGLAMDLINLAVPAPDLLGQLFDKLGPAVDSPEKLSVGSWIRLAGWAALPGLALLALVVLALWRALGRADELDETAMLMRGPLVSQLAERRFTNVVAEMAIAAAIPAPRVLIAERAALNAVALGAADRAPTLIVTRRLLAALDRDEMQGVAAHLVASIANGDLRNGRRVATVVSLFGVLARMATAFSDRTAARSLFALAGAALRPSQARARELLAQLTDPFGPPADATTTAGNETPSGQTSTTLSVREWLWMPLAGPLAMTGFFAGIVSMFLLAPLLALVWRRRKYLADATAVRLTRNPDSLARALGKMTATGSAGALAAWATHLAVVNDAGAPGTSGRGLLSASFVPFFPAPERRLRALGQQGATVQTMRRAVPTLVWAIGVPVGALLALLVGTLIYLLTIVSVMLSALFTMLPAGALHALLRWLSRS